MSWEGVLTTPSLTCMNTLKTARVRLGAGSDTLNTFFTLFLIKIKVVFIKVKKSRVKVSKVFYPRPLLPYAARPDSMIASSSASESRFRWFRSS